MARTVKEQEYTQKRNDILNSAMRLIYTKGFVRMTIQDILADLKISSGAFYHYFDSKPAILEGIIARIKQEVETPILPLLHDPHRTAVQKLQGFFDTLDSLRIERREEISALGRVWYNDDNALVRSKVDEAIIQQRAPLVAEIIRQGIQEGVFTADPPERVGEVILVLLQGMANAHARLLLLPDQKQELDDQSRAERIVAIHTAYMDAVERVLGAPPNSLARTTLEHVTQWISAAKAPAN